MDGSDERVMDALQREPSRAAWRQVVGALLNRADRPLLREHADVLAVWPRELRTTNRAVCRRIDDGPVPTWMPVFKVFMLGQARVPTTDRLAEVLADVEDFDVLSMRYARLGLPGVGVVARRAGFRRLDLLHCGIDTRGLEALSSAGHFDRLEHLNLAHNQVDDGCLDIVLSSRLKTLNLYRNSLSLEVRSILRDWSIEQGVHLHLG